MTRAWFTYISKQQNDFSILWGFYFSQNFAYVKFREKKTFAKISELTVLSTHARTSAQWVDFELWSYECYSNLISGQSSGAFSFYILIHPTSSEASWSGSTLFSAGPCSVVGSEWKCRPRGSEFDLTQSHIFVEINHEIIYTVILLSSTESFKKGCCQLQAKVCAWSTG